MKNLLIAAVCLLSTSAVLMAENAAPSAARPFLCCDHNGDQVCIVERDGRISWRMEAKRPQDCWLLPNGNILFAHMYGATEATRPTDGSTPTIVWEYKAPKDVECHACQPLPDGNVMVVEGGTSRIVEVDRSGKVVKEVKLHCNTPKTHNQYRGTRKLANGHYVVCFKGDRKVVEVDGEGKVIRELPVDGDVHECLTLPGGNWLITLGDGHKVIEVNAAGKTVWELNENDVPGNPLRLMAGCQRLPNGNTVFCNYLGHGHIGKQPMFFEITPDKKLVWQFADHEHFKTINQIQVLDVPGDVTKGEIIR
jgi:outer membrane protein assembly factor BamB